MNWIKIMDFVKRNLTVIAAVLMVLYFGGLMLPASDRVGDFHYHAFGMLPVVDGGRTKPMDTAARMNLMIVRHRQQFSVPDPEKLGLVQAGTKQGTFEFGGREYPSYDEAEAAVPRQIYPATKWMLDCMTSPLPHDDVLGDIFPDSHREAFRHKVFRIENDEVLDLLRLKRVEDRRYSVADFATGFETLDRESRRIKRSVEPKSMSVADGKVLELRQHLELFLGAIGHYAPLVIPNPSSEDQWMSFREAHAKFGDAYDSKQQLPDSIDAQTYGFYRNLLTAYERGEKKEFNAILAAHLAKLRQESPEVMRAMRVEVFFNEFAPFFWSWWAYVAVALLAGVSWLDTSWSQPLRKAAFAMMAITAAVHLSGMILRMYLQDRWFVMVTNLYSSAVFIGLGCVTVSMIAEWFYRNGIALVVGGVTGFCTLIIAHLLSLDGDTMVMMQAVLDTNFWLATHVTCVTLGYTMAFVAGFMGIAYILLGMFTDMLRKEGAANLARMTYGVLCAGMFLSFIGTVLGGLWADYSWGRFWGWDPKENGALLIVIWIALILHARWGGMVKHRGLAVLSVLGIVITSWSWFGTNFLGVGLHAYGGAKADSMLTLVLFDFGFMSIAGLGLIPLENWQSFRPPSTMDPTQAKPKLA
jgi:ABC-type transport system involved in cytochrome c biogenesis permease subunit